MRVGAKKKGNAHSSVNGKIDSERRERAVTGGARSAATAVDIRVHEDCKHRTTPVTGRAAALNRFFYEWWGRERYALLCISTNRETVRSNGPASRLPV